MIKRLIAIFAAFVLLSGSTYLKDFNLKSSVSLSDVKQTQLADENTSDVEFEEVNLSLFYHTGSVLQIPKVNAIYKGEIYKTSHFLYLRQQVFTQDTVKLDQKGDYRLEYAVNIQGKIYRLSKEFAVNDLGNHILINQHNSKIEGNVASPTYMQTSFTGVKITGSSEGASVVYDKIVDISNNTKNDPLITFSLTPSVYGEEDYQQITLTLTDVYDSTNKVNIQLYKGSWSQSVAFVKAGASNQLLTGLDKGVPKIEQRFGQGIKHSFRGFNVGFDTVTYYFDYKERAIYVANPGNTQYGNMVIDLDNPDHFSPTALWNGFTTGEVYVSMTLEKVLNTPASYMVLNINGTDLSQSIIQDTIAPAINILTQDYDIKKPPVAKVGKSYPIFDAKAFDALDGNLTDKIEFKVFKNYGSSKAQLMPIDDRSFVPDIAGDYMVEYSVSDFSCNKGIKTYKVTAVEQDLQPILNVDGTINDVITVGKKYTVPNITVSNGSGNSIIKTYLKDADGNIISNSQAEIFVQKQGQYTYLIETEDYLGNKATKVFQLDAKISNKPIFDIPAMPRYLLKGKSVILPELIAWDYTQGEPLSADYSITVTDAYSTRKLGNDRKFTPIINSQQESVSVKYEVFSKTGGFDSFTVNLDVRDVYTDSTLNLNRVFDLDSGMQYSEDYDSIEISTQSDGEFMLINPILASKFYFEAEIEQGKGNLNAFSIILEDFQDRKNQVVIRVINDGNKCYASVNGGILKEISGSFNSQGADRFKIVYNDATMSIYDNVNQNLLGFLSASGFKGFSSRRLYVTVRLEGVTDTTSIKLYDIGYQPLSNIGMDLIAPALELEHTIKTKAQIGETVIVPKALAVDVLDIATEIEVVVKNSAGVEVLKDNNIAYRSNSFVADTYGGFRIEYTVKDSSGSSDVYTYAVYVEDDQAPILEIKGDVAKKGKVGKKITLPSAIVTDNLDTQIAVKIAVVNPYGVMKTLEGSTFTPDIAGVYRITYYAFDNSGNLVSQHFKVEVSK